jgi:hypothetical protein
MVMNNDMSQFYFILIITVFFIYGSGRQRIDNDEKCRRITGNFDCRANAVVRFGVHRPMEHIPDFNKSQWMPPSVKCSHRIAAAAAMVNDFGRKHNTLTKTIFT